MKSYLYGMKDIMMKEILTGMPDAWSTILVECQNDIAAATAKANAALRKENANVELLPAQLYLNLRYIDDPEGTLCLLSQYEKRIL